MGNDLGCFFFFFSSPHQNKRIWRCFALLCSKEKEGGCPRKTVSAVCGSLHAASAREEMGLILCANYPAKEKASSLNLHLGKVF